MNPARKTAGLGILFLCASVFIPSLDADPIPDAEPPGAESLLGDEFILSEEYLLSDTFQGFILSDEFQEFLLSEELLLEDEPVLEEEALPGEEPIQSEEPFFDEQPLFDAEALLDEELIPDELILDEQPLPDDELSISEEPPFENESFPDDGSLVFEAPPLIYEVAPFIYEPRSFDAIFPGFSHSLKTMAFSNGGVRHSFGKNDSPLLIPDPASGIDILSSVMMKNPSHIIEILMLVPYNERELDMLDIYNALGKIENIKDQSIPINGKDINVFVETTRLESAKNRKSISDPPPADTLPYSETMYLRFREAYFGNLYIRGDVSMSLYGITYSMTNFTDIRYFILPIMKAERFSAVIYLEPVREGVLVYCMSGFYLPNFIADRVNLTPSINSRIAVLINWITDSFRKQESIAVQQ